MLRAVGRSCEQQFEDVRRAKNDRFGCCTRRVDSPRLWQIASFPSCGFRAPTSEHFLD